MGSLKICSGLTVASLLTWLLLLPPFSVTSNGKTYVDRGAPLSQWETLSSHRDDTECLKHRNEMRQKVEDAAKPYEGSKNEGSKKSAGKMTDKGQQAFAILRERLAVARCVSSSDPGLRTPSARPTGK